MGFVQSLLSGETDTQSVLTDLHLTTGAPKTVTAGNTIVVFISRWSFGIASAAGAGIFDNLGHSYTVQWDDTLGARMDSALATTTVTNPGSLTDITVFSGGVGSIAYHIAGCSAEFEEAPSFSSLGNETVSGSPATSISSSAVTVPEALLYYACAIGGDDTVGGYIGVTGYTPPSGFTVASSRASTGKAPSVFLSYKYGSLSSEVLTSTWNESEYADAYHAIGGTYSTFVPQIYRWRSP